MSTTEELKALFLDSTLADDEAGLSAEERAHSAAQGEFVAIYVNEKGMTGAGVYAAKNGEFRVILKDLDCGRYFPSIPIFKDLASADAVAQRAVR